MIAPPYPPLQQMVRYPVHCLWCGDVVATTGPEGAYFRELEPVIRRNDEEGRVICFSCVKHLAAHALGKENEAERKIKKPWRDG